MPDKNPFERYNRNIIIENIGIEGQKKLLNSEVLIAGCGGLGSTVIATLSSIGVGHLGLVDNDKIEISNLNRQFIHKFDNIGKFKVDSAKEWINSYNPDINVKTFQVRLDENNYNDVLKGYDIVIDCFDSYESKFLLNKICVKNGKTLIHGGVTEFYGQVMIIIPGKSACLNCMFSEINRDLGIKGVISPAVSIIASIQAMEAAKIILNTGTSLVNSLLSFDGLNQEFKKIKVKRNTECPICKEL